MRVSHRSDIDPFIVMDMIEAARAAEAKGHDIIHMEVGQPSAGAPQAARSALAADIAGDPLGYTVALGLPELRARIARLYGDWYGVDLDPGRVIVTSGASAGFLLAFSALFDEGARVGLGLPCYPSYRQILHAMGLQAQGLRTRPEDGFHPRPDQVRDLDGLIVTSPSNPTGAILPSGDLAALADRCAQTDTALISDEIYHGLSYEGRATSVLEITDDAYVINSFSKFFTLTGWRIGWMVVPQDHVRQVERLAQNMFICAPHASQKLALYTMDHTADLEQVRDGYAHARRLILEALPAMGLDRFVAPQGAFYVYADISDFSTDSRALSLRILNEAGVATAPGVDFDPGEGHKWLRLSYARGPEHVAQGLDRLAAFFAKAQT